jgi:hypothetical protein
VRSLLLLLLPIDRTSHFVELKPFEPPWLRALIRAMSTFLNFESDPIAGP